MVVSPVVMRRRDKRNASKRSSSIERYLSPSPKKKQRGSGEVIDIENVENGSSRTTNMVDLSMATSEEEGSSSWGLQRISSLEDSLALSPLALFGEEGIKRIQKGSILGRQVSKNPPKRGSNKVNLGIPSTVTGVSRKHLEIVEIESELRIKLIGMNSVSIHEYRQTTNAYKSACVMHHGETKKLGAGDVLVLDSYEATRGSEPQHMFRLVLIQAGSPTKRRRASSRATIDLSQSSRPLSELASSRRSGSLKPTKLNLGRGSSPSEAPPSSFNRRSASNYGSLSSPAQKRSRERTSREASKPTPKTTPEKISKRPPTQTTLGSWAGAGPAESEGSPAARSPATPEVKPARKHESSLEPKLGAEPEARIDVQVCTNTNEVIPATAVSLDARTRLALAKQTADDDTPKPSSVEKEAGDKNIVARTVLDPMVPKAAQMEMDDGQDKSVGCQKVSDVVMNLSSPPCNLAVPVASPERSVNPSSFVAVPKVGDRFRVRYKIYDSIMERELHCWWFGPAIDVSPMGDGKYKIKVSLENHRTLKEEEDEVVYPSPDIELIEADAQSPFVFRRLVRGSSGLLEAGEVVLNENPENIDVGALVDCKFQDGMDVPIDRRDLEWHRGRVAKVENGTCDVVYFDGDYEGLIPICQSKIKLVDSSREWLLGQTVRLPAGGKGRRRVKRQLGKVTKMDALDNLKMSVKVSFSRKDVVFKHEEVVKAVFAEIWERKKGTACKWPSAAVPKSATKARKLNSGFEEDHKELMEHEHVKEKLWSEDTDPCALQDMDSSLALCIWGALNSESPRLGSELTELAMCVHKQGPTVEFGRNLLDLVVQGPRHDGKQFADPCRIQHVVSFIDMCSEDRFRMDALSKATRFDSFEQLEVFLSSLAARLYEHEDESTSASLASLTRATQSTQLASAAAQLLVRLMDHQLEKWVGPNEESIDREEFRCVPLVRCLRENRRGGVRDSWKTIMGLYAKCFVENRLYHVQFAGLKDQDSEWSVVQELFRASKKLCRDLGIIASHTARIYAIEGEIKMTDKSLANVCRDALQTELAKVHLAPAGGKKKIEAYMKDLKCRWALGMSSGAVDPLVVNVGSMLGVENEVAFCLDPVAFLE